MSRRAGALFELSAVERLISVCSGGPHQAL